MRYTGCASREIALCYANALVKKLRGTGWKPVVFENVGWHWRAISGPVQVYPAHSNDLRFWCMIGSHPSFWTPTGARNFKDPNRAVREALSYVYPFVQQINLTLHAAEKAAGVPSKQTLRNRK